MKNKKTQSKPKRPYHRVKNRPQRIMHDKNGYFIRFNGVKLRLKGLTKRVLANPKVLNKKVQDILRTSTVPQQFRGRIRPRPVKEPKIPKISASEKVSDIQKNLEQKIVMLESERLKRGDHLPLLDELMKTYPTLTGKIERLEEGRKLSTEDVRDVSGRIDALSQNTYEYGSRLAGYVDEAIKAYKEEVKKKINKKTRKEIDVLASKLGVDHSKGLLKYDVAEGIANRVEDEALSLSKSGKPLKDSPAIKAVSTAVNLPIKEKKKEKEKPEEIEHEKKKEKPKKGKEEKPTKKQEKKAPRPQKVDNPRANKLEKEKLIEDLRQYKAKLPNDVSFYSIDELNHSIRDAQEEWTSLTKELQTLPQEAQTEALTVRKDLTNDALRSFINTWKKGHPEMEETGLGLNREMKDKGLTNKEIDSIMAPLRDCGYLGAFPSDYFQNIGNTIRDLGLKRASCIINTQNSYQPGQHWRAVYFDMDDDNEVDWYDSLGDQPTLKDLQHVKHIVDTVQPETFLKFKCNTVRNQRANSDTCGWFAIDFLLRRYKGEPFSQITGWGNIMQHEDHIRNFKLQMKRSLIPFKLI